MAATVRKKRQNPKSKLDEMIERFSGKPLDFFSFALPGPGGACSLGAGGWKTPGFPCFSRLLSYV
jgi:hypothetical protein